MNTKEINDLNYKDVLNEKDTPMLIKFGANWCAPCRTMNPIIDELKNEHENVGVYNVDVDECPDLSSFFKVKNIPYFVFYKDGKVQTTSIGVVDKQSLKHKIESLTQ